jgi:hypothetical protein
MVRTIGKQTVLPGILTLLLSAAEAQTQTKTAPKAEIKVTSGMYGYDEDLHTAVGGAFAYYPFSQANVSWRVFTFFPGTRSPSTGSSVCDAARRKAE